MRKRDMTSNDKIILDEILKQGLTQVDPNTTESSFFEFFTAEQVLKDFDLSNDEIESGLVGAGGDGGIDSIYLLINGELAQEDYDYSHLRRDITIDLIIVQSKTRAGFQESPIERFITVSNDLFDLSIDLQKITEVYNERLLEVMQYFHDIWRQLATRFPTLNVTFCYASKGDVPGANLRRKVRVLQSKVEEFFPSANFSFDFLGAPELLDLARRFPQRSYPLQLADTPISAENGDGFVCLVGLGRFFEFLTDESGKLRRQMLEANVRDYQGRTAVNDGIQDTLENANSEDFWWLNNGVSILASKATLAGKTLSIEDPLVVNGLQTSTEIFEYFRSSDTENEQRKILAKVMVPTEDESRDRVIKATNSQTTVQAASLRATDKIHRDIEEYLRPRGLFYDRRKNFYKNEGKPRSQIVGIQYMAQAVMAIVLRQPDTARARPSTLIKSDDNYKLVFNDSYPIHLYYVCVRVMRTIEQHLKSPMLDVPQEHRNNLRFYVAMHAVLTAINQHGPNAIADYDWTRLDELGVKASVDAVQKEYFDLGGNDQVAKGKILLKNILHTFE